MARAAIGWSTRQLSDIADVGLNTVNRFEGGGNTREGSIDAMRRALESGGVEFIPENGGGAGVRLKRAAE